MKADLKKICCLFILLFFHYTFSGTGYAASEIKVGIYNNEPLIFVDADGKGKGFFADIIEYVAQKEAWQIKYVPGTWQQCLSRLENNQIDILCTIAFSTDRDKRYDFNKENLLTNWAQLYTARNSHIKAITDLKEKKIAVLNGDIHYTAFQQLSKKFGIRCHIIETDDYLSVMDLVSRHKADAGIVNRFFGMKYGETYAIDKSGIIFNPIKIYYAAPEGKNAELLAAMDRHIKLLKSNENSVYYQSLGKWFGAVSGKWQFPQWGKWTIGISLGIIIFLFIGSLILRDRIKERTLELTIELNRRKQAEKDLRQAYTIINRSPVIVFRWKNTDGWPVEFVTDNVLDLFGYSATEFCSGQISYDRLIHPDDLERVIKEVITAGKEDEKTNFVHNAYRIITKSGKIKWLYDRTHIRRDAAGDITHYEGAVMDLTDRKQAEDALAQSEEKYRNILENIDDGYFEVDIAGNFTFFNEAMCRILGYPGNELMGMHSRQYMDKKNSKKIYLAFNRVYRTGESTKALDWELLRKDGSVCFAETVVSLMLDSHGRRIGFRGIARDITDRRLLEDQLRQAQKMESIGTLAGGIAHDFNNLLYMIIGNTELALENLPESNPNHAYLEKIKTASLRAAGIVKQLLNFSRKTEKKFKPIDMTMVLRDAIKFIRSTLPVTIEIQTDIPDKPCTVFADPIQINQVLMNICINASHAMEETGGTLTVKVEETSITGYSAFRYPDLTSGEYIKITIEDTGHGIAADIIDRIFDPYFTTKEIGKGSGMGLAVVQGIVKNHNGAITVRSPAGKGACFSILFPLLDEEPVDDPDKADTFPVFSDASILFVDDEETIADMIGEILKELGFKAETRTDPLEALKLFQSKPDAFDLVITDMTMPQMTGVAFSEKLMTIRPDIPIIICTGHSSQIDREKARQIGIADYIMKPISMNELASAIQNIFNK